MFGSLQDQKNATVAGAFNNLRGTETLIAKPQNDAFQMNGHHQSFNAEVTSALYKQNESVDQWARFYNTMEEDYIFTVDQLPFAL